MSTHRTFTENDGRNRDAWIHAAVEDSCVGCVEDERGWVPTQDCPAHGEHCEVFYRDLNAELDARWPGVWVAA